LEVKEIKKGFITVEVKKACFDSMKKNVEILRDKQAEVRFDMEPICGELAVTSEPSEAEWYLDGEYAGKTPGIKKNVIKGSHEVVVRKDGYNDWSIYIDVSTGQQTVLQASLSNVPASKITNSIDMEFVYIEPGTFVMGSPSNEKDRDVDEKQHEVTLTKGFYMGVTEVTQGQWIEIMRNNPSYFKFCGDDCPVEFVSWNEVQEFIKQLNKKEGADKYRLPTEAEWEYACRAGSTSRFSFGDSDSRLGEYAWFKSNSDHTPHPVGKKNPNDWGLYDMHGNVGEWCEDWYGDYPSGSMTDPEGPSSGSFRVYRGGSWRSDASICRSARHDSRAQSSKDIVLGFRLVRNP
jgi:formylglycine-generating enzyme required for sulfatase activity